MPEWLQALRAWHAARRPALLVIVAEVRGSAPREVGARMAVSVHDVVGTIGGGHLEWQAIALARAQLAGGLEGLAQVRRFALGASLGQCCGGAVTLWFEAVSPLAGQAAWLDTVHERLAAGQVSVLESFAGVAARAGRRLLATGANDASEARLIAAEDGGEARLIDVIAPPACRIAVFGAGHVGQALVPMLRACEAAVIWIDSRAELLPAALAGVDCRWVDEPVDEVAALPAGCHVIVLTHSHALDEALARAVLARDDLGWFGLIGSQTKRRRFVARLTAMGLAPERIAAMECPISVPGLVGKQPGLVALAIATRALQAHARWSAGAGVGRSQAATALRRHGDSVK